MLRIIAAAVATIGSTQAQVQIHSNMTDSAVTVTASQTIRMTATAASIYAVVEGSADSPSGAVTRVGERVRILLDSLARLGKRAVAEKPIAYRVTPIIVQPGYGSYPSAASGGFVAHDLLRIRIPNIDDLGTVQAAALAGGAASITGQTFEVAEADSVWLENVKALGAATRNAARALVAAQGRQLGRLLDVSSNGFGGGSSGTQISLDVRSGSYGGSPEISVNASVSMRFQLRPEN
jgi:uncharacterized protein YggE